MVETIERRTTRRATPEIVRPVCRDLHAVFRIPVARRGGADRGNLATAEGICLALGIGLLFWSAVAAILYRLL